MDNSEVNEKRNLVMDATILGTIQSCPFKGFLSFIQHFKPNIPNVRMEGGSLGHAVLERYYKLLKQNINFEDALNDALEIGRQSYVDMTLETADAEWILETCRRYAEKNRYDGIKVLDVEKAFLMPIYEDDDLRILYSGKIDLIAEFPVIGKACLDHKFRGRKNEETILSNQFIGYAAATESPVVYVNEVGLQKTIKDDERFRRIPLSYQAGHITKWKKDVVFWGKQIDYFFQTNTWPRVFNNYICKGCQYNRVCMSSSDEEMIRQLKQNFYVGEEWDVSKELEGEA